MIENGSLLIAALLGLTVGGVFSLFYFGGLWLTVQRVVGANRPKLLLLGSFVGRTLVVLVGFYLVTVMMGERWELLVFSLLGFVAARTILVRRWKPQRATPSSA